MPPWTETELEEIAPFFSDATEWRKCFKVLGGIPRHVLESMKRAPIEILEAACAICSLDDYIKIIGMDSEMTEKSKVIHSLVHITSTPPFTKSSVCYTSQTALETIVQIRGEEAKRRMRDLLASCEGNPITAALCGYIFESYTIELLQKGGTFISHWLEYGNMKSNQDEFSLFIPPSTKQVVDKALSNQTRNQLYVPEKKNYPSIDAWIPGVGAFQMTISMKHGIKACVRDDLALLGEGANKLYWLLLPRLYNSFVKKAPYDIDQYAVLIPYPSVEDQNIGISKRKSEDDK